MAAAVVVTVLAVVVGVLVRPGESARDLGGDARLVSLDLALTRAGTISRSAERELARARTTYARDQKAPAFKVHAAGKPLTLKPVPRPGDPFTFQVGSLNVLGSQHTRGARGYGPGTVRTGRAAGVFLSRGIDLLGLQEVQDDQLNVLYNQLGGFGIWPGRGLGNNGVRLQIAYRTALFELVDSGYITTRFDFQTRPIPYVLLRDRVTGGEFWVVTIHNSPRTQEADRDSATAAEIALFNRLRATGQPRDRDRRHEREGGVVLQGSERRRHGRGQRRQRRRRLLAASWSPPDRLDHGWRRRRLLRLRPGPLDAGRDHRPLLRALDGDRHADRDGRAEGLSLSKR